jgi:hypothetical protein
MTEEEQDYHDKLNLFAGIALPGVIGKVIWVNTEDIAKQAFDIAEAMMKESLLRQPKSEEPCTQE